MMRTTWLGLLLLLFAVSTAQAQTTMDVAKITCAQFISSKVASPDKIVIWLSGYYHGKRGSTIIDVQQLGDWPQKMTSYCADKDKETLMEAVEKLLSSGK